MSRADLVPMNPGGPLSALRRGADRLASILVTLFNEQPARFFAYLLVGQLLLWGLLPILFFRGLPLDLIENVAWSRHFELGYYKHPPLQVWLVMAMLDATGGWAKSPLWLGPLSSLAAFVPIFLLGREAAGARAGLFAVILFSLCFYATIALPEFNANVVQFPIWAFAGLALWRGIARPGLSWWLALGLALALAVLAKYSVAILVVSLVVAGLSLAEGRRALRTPGPYVAAGVALLLTLPHFYWLWQSDWLPFQYAEMRAKVLTPFGRIYNPLEFLATQAIDFVAPIVLVLIGLGPRIERRPDDGIDFPSEPAIRRFITLLAIVPMALTLLIPVIGGHGLLSMWGGPLLVWATLAVVLWLRPAYRSGRLGLMLFVWLSAFVLTPVITCAVSVIGPHIGAVPQRTAWPADALALKITEAWHAATGKPLRIVAGETWDSGIVSAYSPDAPSVYVDAVPSFNPWITPERIAREGLMLVWPGQDAAASPEYAALGPYTITGRVEVPLIGENGPSVSLNYAIRPPAE